MRFMQVKMVLPAWRSCIGNRGSLYGVVLQRGSRNMDFSANCILYQDLKCEMAASVTSRGLAVGILMMHDQKFERVDQLATETVDAA